MLPIKPIIRHYKYANMIGLSNHDQFNLAVGYKAANDDP